MNSLDSMAETIRPQLKDYRFDPFRGYPADRPDAWEGYFISRLQGLLKDPLWTVFSSEPSDPLCVLACRVSPWDSDHFGFGMASIHVVFCPEQIGSEHHIAKLLNKCLEELRRRDVRFVSARIQGDQLQALHGFEESGFRYFDNVIWPVVTTRDVDSEPGRGVRLMVESDLGRVVEIAENNCYGRGHFYCDRRFDRTVVNRMYGKWVRTAWGACDPIAVIEESGQVQGFFLFGIDPTLSAALGRKYGRMRLLAMDSAAQGKGQGKVLFRGAMSVMKSMGADLIDSGYSTKNHASARIHARMGFHSAYEEVTLHLWLGPK